VHTRLFPPSLFRSSAEASGGSFSGASKTLRASCIGSLRRPPPNFPPTFASARKGITEFSDSFLINTRGPARKMTEWPKFLFFEIYWLCNWSANDRLPTLFSFALPISQLTFANKILSKALDLLLMNTYTPTHTHTHIRIGTACSYMYIYIYIYIYMPSETVR
jgi:hypothetical protein